MTGATRPLVLVTRPEPDATRLAAHLERGGYATLVAPMLEIARMNRLDAADLAGAQAVLITSPRGAAAAGEDIGRDGLASCHAVCVGDRTADVARAAGFGRVDSANGFASDLLERVGRRFRPDGGRLVVLRGRDTAVDLESHLVAAGFTVSSHQLYRADPAKGLPKRVVDAFVEKQVAAVLLLSKRTAWRLGELIDADCGGVDLGSAAAICISEELATATETARFGRCVAAETPDLAAMLRTLDALLGGSASQTERLC